MRTPPGSGCVANKSNTLEEFRSCHFPFIASESFQALEFEKLQWFALDHRSSFSQYPNGGLIPTPLFLNRWVNEAFGKPIYALSCLWP
jgi:hypothetical protein